MRTNGDVLSMVDAPQPVKEVEWAAVTKPVVVEATDATSEREAALVAAEAVAPAPMVASVAVSVAVSVAAIEARVAADMQAGEPLSRASMAAEVAGVDALVVAAMQDPLAFDSDAVGGHDELVVAVVDNTKAATVVLGHITKVFALSVAAARVMTTVAIICAACFLSVAIAVVEKRSVAVYMAFDVASAAASGGYFFVTHVAFPAFRCAMGLLVASVTVMATSMPAVAHSAVVCLSAAASVASLLLYPVAAAAARSFWSATRLASALLFSQPTREAGPASRDSGCPSLVGAAAPDRGAPRVPQPRRMASIAVPRRPRPSLQTENKASPSPPPPRSTTPLCSRASSSFAGSCTPSSCCSTPSLAVLAADVAGRRRGRGVAPHCTCPPASVVPREWEVPTAAALLARRRTRQTAKFTGGEGGGLAGKWGMDRDGAAR